MHDDDLFDRPLTPAPDDAEAHLFERGELGDLRAAVSRFAFRAGLAPDRVDDLVVAVNEITTNSVRHAGGGGRLRLLDRGRPRRLRDHRRGADHVTDDRSAAAGDDDGERPRTLDGQSAVRPGADPLVRRGQH